MAASFANAVNAFASNQTSDTVVFAGALSVGSTLVLLLAGWNPANFNISTVSDGTQTWIDAPSTDQDAPDTTEQEVDIWYFEDNQLTTTPTVTVTAAASGSYFRWGIVEVKGVETSTVIRDEGTAQTTPASTSSSVSSNTTDPVADDAVLAVITCALSADTDINIAGGLTTELWIYQDFNDIAGEASYGVASSSGTQTASWTHDSDLLGQSMLVLKSAAVVGVEFVEPELQRNVRHSGRYL